MNEFISPVKSSDWMNLKDGPLDRRARRFILNLLKKIEKGKIDIKENNSHQVFGRVSPQFPLEAVVEVHHPRLFTRLFFGGIMGAAEAYMEGLWTSRDVATVIRVFLLNQNLFNEMRKGPARVTDMLHDLYQVIKKNTRTGSKKNIHAHYDLGNDFYKLFLDETMTYSCGIFTQDNPSLKDASLAKYDRICRKLALSPGDRVVEIGTGWGGFALYAVENFDIHVTTTTISSKQYRYVHDLIRKKGMEENITLLQLDYREMTGAFDKLVSIEMIEAVGYQYFNTFFKACSDLLKDDGLMVLQAITIGDQIFDRHKRSVDFIKRYIFPGSCIPSITAIHQAIARNGNLQLIELDDITPHYAKTLRAWRNNFYANLEKVRKLGFSEAFIRMWEYYLCYCEGGFAERYINDVQMVFAKPLWRHPQQSVRDHIVG